MSPRHHTPQSHRPRPAALAACLSLAAAALLAPAAHANFVQMVEDIDTVGTPLYTSCFLSACPPPIPLYGSLPSQLTAVDRRLTEHAVQWRLAFVADDRVHGAEVWFSDATAPGTYMVTDLRPGAAGSAPQLLGSLGNGELLFLADDGTAGERLWRTDGTADGTVVLADPCPECDSDPPPALPDSDLSWTVRQVPSARFDGKLWFPIRRSDGVHVLWASDGTAAGTGPVFVPCGGPGCGASITQLLVVDDRLFLGVSGTTGVRPALWAVGAGGAPPVRIAEGCTASRGSLDAFLALGDRLVFRSPCLASDPTTANRPGIYASGGAAGDATLLVEAAGSQGLGPPAAGGGHAWVAVHDATGAVVWRTDGTPAGTAPALSGYDEVGALVPLEDRLLFVTWVDGASPVLRSFDGSGVVDLLTSDVGSPVVDPFGQAIFAAAGPDGGTELWRSDGTELGTWRIRDIAPGPASSDPADLVQIAAWVFFSADDGEHGRELWAVDWVSLEFPCPEGELCLADGRFRVEVAWDDGRGNTGIGQPTEFHSESSGLFSFFHPDNWELLAKVLDGCGVNGHHWVFSAAATNVGYTLRVRDVTTGLEWERGNPPGRPAPAIFDTAAFPCNGAGDGGPPASIAAIGPAAAGPPVSAVDRLSPPPPIHFLHGGRFLVEASWRDYQGNRGSAFPVVGSERSGVFGFFRGDNWELLAKVLDGCGVNGHWWVLAAAPTTVEFTLEVHDTERDRTWTFENPLGRPAPAVLDTQAFTCSP